MKTAIVLYMPALHKGYIDFIKKNGRKINTIFLISEEFAHIINPELAWLFEKDLRAVSVVEMQKALYALEFADKVDILDERNLYGFDIVVIPDDDEIVQGTLENFYPTIVAQKESWFIRWGKKTVLSQRAPIPNAIISCNELEKEIMIKAFNIAEKSSDWWRQVGVIIFPINSPPIFGFNAHLPHAQAPYINGDPRTNFKPGEFIELSTAGHAEATAIAYAAKRGIALEDASIYVTVFPCPGCSWLIINSGIKKLYYCEGFSQMHSEKSLNAKGVEIIFVDVPL